MARAKDKVKGREQDKDLRRILIKPARGTISAAKASLSEVEGRRENVAHGVSRG